MYHIPNDKRAQRSAERIFMSLMECQKKAAVADISVTDIAAGAGIGRSTFYRLFDNSVDILIWKSEMIMTEALRCASDRKSFDEIFLTFISGWMEQKMLLQALLRASMTDILFQVHINHIDEIKAIFLKDVPQSAQQQEYLATLLAAMMATAFRLWDRQPDTKPEQMLLLFREALSSLEVIFNR